MARRRSSQDKDAAPARLGSQDGAEEPVAQLLRESPQTLRAMLDHSPVAIYFKDLDGRFMMVNRKFEDYYCPRGEALGRTITEILGSGPCTEDFSDADRTVMDTRAPIEYETFAQWADGRPNTDFTTIKFPIFSSDGQLLGVGGFDMDITERKHAESALREAHSQLERRVVQRTAELSRSNRQLERALAELTNAQDLMLQSEKMASIGQMAAGIAHEINNPAGFTASNLTLLAEYMADIRRLAEAYRRVTGNLPVSDDATLAEAIAGLRQIEGTVDIQFLLDDIEDLLTESRDGVRRIKQIVQTLDVFAHADQGTMMLLDINELLDDSLKMVQGELKNKAVVERQLGALPAVYGVANELRQVFVNLLVNAAQAIEHHGRIRVSSHDLHDGQIEVVVNDDGCGIAREHLGRIFDPFFTTKPVGKGTGLGLNVVYNIVLKHNGTIEAVSETDKGTSLILRLPTAS